MILYSLLCLCIWQLSLVTTCTLDILQAPKEIKDVQNGSQVQFSCTIRGTCEVNIISVETPDKSLMIKNSSYYLMSDKDIEFQGTMTDFTITMNVRASNSYYCAARWQHEGDTYSNRSEGSTIILVKDAGMSVIPQIPYLGLFFLVCIHVGI